MKKLFSLLLVALMVFAMTACAPKEADKPKNTPEPAANTPGPVADTPEPTQSSTLEGKPPKSLKPSALK